MNILLRILIKLPLNSPSPHEHVEDKEKNGEPPAGKGIFFKTQHMIFTIELFHKNNSKVDSYVLVYLTIVIILIILTILIILIIKSCVLPIFSSGILKTLINRPLSPKAKYFDNILLIF